MSHDRRLGGKSGGMCHLLRPVHDAENAVLERQHLAVGEAVILLHTLLPLVGVSIGTKRRCHQNDSLADG